jgi:hypothetical protein
MPQLQINQGPQDALLYDNTRSYFTNVGYVRTSNFQVEYRQVDSQNAMQFGSTVQYVIPKAADLLGPVDLRVTIPYGSNGISGDNTLATDMSAYSAFVDELGFAMIDKVTFSVGSNDIETITGEQMQIKNELMTSDEQRLGFDHVMKTGRAPFACYATTLDRDGVMTDELPGADGAIKKVVNKDFTRVIGFKGYGGEGSAVSKGAITANMTEKTLIIPLNLFFTKHVSQYFPLAAVAGCNDVRISIKFRPLKELIKFGGFITKGAPASGKIAYKVEEPTFGTIDAKLMCHYVHVTGPEATTLMNKEHVRLLKLWQHQHKTFSSLSGSRLDLDLSFLHPVTTLIITIRRDNDMTSDIGWNVADANNTGGPTVNNAHKGFFFYHGDGTNPNYDRIMMGESATNEGTRGADELKGTIRLKSIQLTLNGQERHPGLDKGIDAQYLQSRLLPMLHSNSNSVQKQTMANMSLAVNAPILHGQTQMEYGMQGSKNIFVYPFSLNPEGSNPSGAVNFSKVSHAKLSLHLDDPTASALDAASPIKSTASGMPGDTNTATSSPLRVDVYGLYYNWLQIKSGRALLSFA